MVSTKKIIRIMDKYHMEKLLLSPQHHTIENGSLEWFINLFPEIDPLKMKLKFDSLYNSKKICSQILTKTHELQNVCSNDSQRFKMIYTIDINSSNIIEELQTNFKKSEYSAVKVNNLFSSMNMKNKNVISVINFCKINKLPLLVYVYKRKDGDFLHKLALENPSNKFIIASLSGLEFFEYYSEIPRNLLCEVNNLNLVSDYRLLKALNIFGPNQLVFSYEAICEENLKYSIQRIMNLSVPEFVKKQILSSNTMTLFI